MGLKTIDPAEAFKRFAKQDITVRTGTPTTPKIKDAEGNDTGKTRPGFIVKEAKLAPEHILGAAKRDDGSVVITTIDGAKYESSAAAAA